MYEFFAMLTNMCFGLISLLWRQIYFLPDPGLSPIPFCALLADDQFLVERVPVAQASSLRTLDCARARWDVLCSTTPPSPEVGVGFSLKDRVSSYLSSTRNLTENAIAREEEKKDRDGDREFKARQWKKNGREEKCHSRGSPGQTMCAYS